MCTICTEWNKLTRKEINNALLELIVTNGIDDSHIEEIYTRIDEEDKEEVS